MTAHELLVAPFAHMPPRRVLEGLSPNQAAAPVPGAPHTVVEVLAHMVFWQTWFLDRCTGVATPMASPAATGWPRARATDWDPLCTRFHEGLESAVTLASGESADARLSPPIEFPPLGEYTVHDAMVHVAMHNAHHLGQVVTLRQMLGEWPPPGGSWTW